jgi:pyruvate,orthophosphate dikinase
VCQLEFTYESGELWLLQVRRGGLSGRAAVRSAVDLVDEGVLSRGEALLRITPGLLRRARTPGLAGADVLARGTGASPGVASGRVARSSERAIQLATGGPVILVRPETSPLDMGGLAAAAGVVTARGGPTSHAAVVARSMGKPAVVGVRGLITLDLPEGTEITIDGASGEVALGTPATITTADSQLGRLLEWADEVTGGFSDRPEVDRLTAAQELLRTSNDT